MMFIVALIEIPLMLIALLIVKVYKAAEQAVGARSRSMPKETTKELSEEQRIQIVNSILESSLLINDSCLDALLNEGEALYPAPEACKIKAKDFELQYSSKVWLKAWIRALSTFFDAKSEYVGDGVFHVYGKEV